MTSTGQRKRKRTFVLAALAVVVAVVWNFVPFWFVHDGLSEPMRALWIWGVFPLSVPIFYAFLDRYADFGKAGKPDREEASARQ